MFKFPDGLIIVFVNGLFESGSKQDSVSVSALAKSHFGTKSKYWKGVTPPLLAMKVQTLTRRIPAWRRRYRMSWKRWKSQRTSPRWRTVSAASTTWCRAAQWTPCGSASSPSGWVAGEHVPSVSWPRTQPTWRTAGPYLSVASAQWHWLAPHSNWLLTVLPQLLNNEALTFLFINTTCVKPTVFLRLGKKPAIMCCQPLEKEITNMFHPPRKQQSPLPALLLSGMKKVGYYKHHTAKE